MGGGEDHADFLWAYYGKSVFYSSHAKKEEKVFVKCTSPVWNTH